MGETYNDRLEFLREKAGKLSRSPGVYLMRDRSGKIIYVGKAKALRNRVSSYFHRIDNHNAKTYKLVGNVYDFDFIVTSSELDALVLEASQIKLHKPRYNILLKDDKGYSYVKISPAGNAGKGEIYQRITYSMNNSDKNAEYIGPYVSLFSVKQSIEEANRVFMLPTCTRKFPAEIGKGRPCLNYHIKRCAGICLGEITHEEYGARIKSAVEYIKKGSKGVEARLEQEMNEAAELLQFERAARLRDQLKAIGRAKNSHEIFTSKMTDYDVVAIARNVNLASACIIKYRGGRVSDKENFFIGEEYEPAMMLSDFLLQYYDKDKQNVIPPEIYLEEEPDDSDVLCLYLSEKKGNPGHKTAFVVPKRGEGLTQITLARSNAAEYLALRTGRTVKELSALEGLQKLLSLPKIPDIIESYDISNIGNDYKVGGMVVYKSGRPFKAGYRKFTIKESEGQDDYASMQEVIRRRFTRYLEGDESFGTLPDLILLDGGKGHVSAVTQVLDEFRSAEIDSVQLFGMVKDNKHRTRAIVAKGGEEIAVSMNKSVFTFLTGVQDEVHRFSIKFQRDTHKKKSEEMILLKFPGIGKKKAEAVMKHFRTKSAIKSASAEELGSAAKISREKAEELRKFIAENF
ncbi:UvrABC system protein C [Clostridia bacterium]|nr:UvrABC system protein C [Clostridia bacterium]